MGSSLPLRDAAPSGLSLGVWQPGAPWNMRELTSFESRVGKKMAIVMWYQGWGASNAPFDPTIVKAVADHGAMPLITWEPWDYTKGINQPAYSTANIAAGKFDDYVASWARSLKSYGKPVFLRFAHEMNAYIYPWSANANGNNPQSYVAAWRHVHDIFASVGAANVLWVWSPTVKDSGTVPYADVYPGDSYVDWIALDGYNGGTALPWGGWRTFTHLFSASYQDMIQLSQKPLMIAEVGSVEQGGSKDAWIADALLTQLPQNFPLVRALVWFNEDWHDDQRRQADWRIESSPGSLAAYSLAADDPYFK